MIQSNIFLVKKVQEVIYLQVPSFLKAGLLHHGFSTRHGGLSKGYLEAMNLSYNTDDESDTIKANYDLISKAIGIMPEHIVMAKQLHHDHIGVVKAIHKGSGYNKPLYFLDHDALITNEMEITLTTTYADCVPILFYDPVLKVIGMAHSGWRGTALKIGAKTVIAMKETYGCQSADILVAILPSIRPCHFQVSKEVKEVFDKAFNHVIIDKIVKPDDHVEDRFRIDLQQAIVESLLEQGILLGQITINDICTNCHMEDFYSHRGTNGKRGAMAAMMSLS